MEGFIEGAHAAIVAARTPSAKSDSGSTEETGAGSGELSQDVIDHAIFKSVDGEIITHPAVPTESRTRKGVPDGLAQAQVDEEDALDEKVEGRKGKCVPDEDAQSQVKEKGGSDGKLQKDLGPDVYNHKVTHSRKRKKVDLDEVNARLMETKSKFHDGWDIEYDSHVEEEPNTEEEPNVTRTERRSSITSSVLEKGIIYFFYRATVGANLENYLEGEAQSYFVLRPLPIDANPGIGPIQDNGDSRLLALWKRWPKSTEDKFLCVVDKTGLKLEELREQLSARGYGTTMSNNSNLPHMVTQGIYGIINNGGKSHLAYQVSSGEISKVQLELGIKAKASFVCSVQNPPILSREELERSAEYPTLQNMLIQSRCTPLVPKHLEYEGIQIILIGGEAAEGKAAEKKEGEEIRAEEELERFIQEALFPMIEDKRKIEELFQDRLIL